MNSYVLTLRPDSFITPQTRAAVSQYGKIRNVLIYAGVIIFDTPSPLNEDQLREIRAIQGVASLETMQQVEEDLKCQGLHP
jgi:hypothetical protein